MADDTQKPGQPLPRDAQISADELQNEDFQFVLKALLAAYQPILEEELKLAGDPAGLSKQAAGGPPDCDAEITRAIRIFGTFFSEEVAIRHAPARSPENPGSGGAMALVYPAHPLLHHLRVAGLPRSA